jgi:hypothetical protein
MQSAISTARQARTHYRHHLHALTYVVLDEANGGIVRNLSHEGVAVQAVGALRPAQNVRLRFELRNPRVRIEARGEVMWANSFGQCGIRFLDLPAGMIRQINQWILGSLLESAPAASAASGSMLQAIATRKAGAAAWTDDDSEQGDGLVVSSSARSAIQLDLRNTAVRSIREPAARDFLRQDLSEHDFPEHMLPEHVLPEHAQIEKDWLSQPLSGRSLAWTVDSLMVFAALLIFSSVFLAVTHELPKWPLATATGTALLMAAFYWSFFRAFGGASLGIRLARLAAADLEDGRNALDNSRFR